MLFWDIETRSLDLNKNDITVIAFAEDDNPPEVTDIRKAYIFFEAVDRHNVFVGHNTLGFDIHKIREYAPFMFCNISDPKNHIDTLVASRLKNFLALRTHSLEEWGSKLGYEKLPQPEDWGAITEELKEYAKRDVEVTRRVYKELESFIKDPSNKEAMRLEHDIAFEFGLANKEGFPFNLDEAVELEGKLNDGLFSQRSVFKEEIPPVYKPKGLVKVRCKADGAFYQTTLNALCSPKAEVVEFEDGEFVQTYEEHEFNPNSHKDRIELLHKEGWKPFDKTKTHIKSGKTTPEMKKYGWKVNEANLETLPEGASTAAKTLAQYLVTTSRASMLRQWVDSYDLEKFSVRGSMMGIGAWTQRVSHSKPNMANIPSPFKEKAKTPVEKIKEEYDTRLRGLFTGKDGKPLTGMDAKSIQLRVLAYYMKDPEFTKEVMTGDIHTENMKALGRVCKSRDAAKKFIYSWILGAGVVLLSYDLGCSVYDATTAVRSFEKRWKKGLSNVDIFVKDAIWKGYFIGLDGRKIYYPNAKDILAGMLQSGEAIIMKQVYLRAKEIITPHSFTHDEIQGTLIESFSKTLYETCLEIIGIDLSTKYFGEHDYSPVIEFKVKQGKNWAETH